MTILSTYIIIALALSLLVMISDSGEDKHKRIVEEKRDGIAVAILLLVWPFTIVLTVLIYINELYKVYYTKKILKIISKSSFPLEIAVKSFSVDELKALLKGSKMGIIYLSPSVRQTVEKLITDKSFEEHFLEDKR